MFIQRWVFLTSRGLPIVEVERPQLHDYPTFETSLPLKFCKGPTTVRLDPQNLFDSTAGKVRRPDLTCGLCRPSGTFNRVETFWLHVAKSHPEEKQAERLQEIKRGARAWTGYLTRATKPRCSDQTLARLAEALEDGFDWEKVIAWRLGS